MFSFWIWLCLVLIVVVCYLGIKSSLAGIDYLVARENFKNKHGRWPD